MSKGLLEAHLAALGVACWISDERGRVVRSDDGVPEDAPREEIVAGSHTVGEVRAAHHGRAIADFVADLVQAEVDRRALGAEALQRYEELTFLYRVSERLALSMAPRDVASLVVDQARQLVRADSLGFWLVTSKGELERVATTGAEVDAAAQRLDVAHVQETGELSVVEGAGSSTLYAPVKTATGVYGVLVVGPTQGVLYGSEESKLCRTLGLQAAHAIETARQARELKEHGDHLEELVRARTASLRDAMAEIKEARAAELDYLRDVSVVSAAAGAIEAGTFDEVHLKEVERRDDELGQLARVFARMARHVHVREQRLRASIERLRRDIAEHRTAAELDATRFVPMDRRVSLERQRDLPTRAEGAALFSDIAGFTPVADALARDLGEAAGAEHLVRELNATLNMFVEAIHGHGGSVIAFAGDAVTCWFDDAPDGEAAVSGARRALATARAIAQALAGSGASEYAFTHVKSVVVSGTVFRLLVGDPRIQRIDVIAGALLDRLGAGEEVVTAGDILTEQGLADTLGLRYTGPRTAPDGTPFVRVEPESITDAPWPWPPVVSGEHTAHRSWVQAPLYDRLTSESAVYLAELRETTALFLSFGGIAYADDPEAASQLDAYVRWVQAVCVRHDGDLVQLSTGDKGNYLYITFNGLTPNPDDAPSAIRAAFELITPPADLAPVRSISVGLARGTMRRGTYGGARRCAFGVQGDATNVAARLMALNDGILCSREVRDAAQQQFGFVQETTRQVKGKAGPIEVHRPVRARATAAHLVDMLPPALRLTLKVASVLGDGFDASRLAAVHPQELPEEAVAVTLDQLEVDGILRAEGSGFVFANPAIRQAAYDKMLFAQRRRLHRCAAEYLEMQTDSDAPLELLEELARHWESAGDDGRAIDYLERASRMAHARGDLTRALEHTERARSIALGGAPAQ